jgi:hypothetical protein
MIYLKAPSLHDAGFINSNYNDYLRMKQGLMPQNLASNCFSPPLSYSYNVPVDRKYSCNGPNFYPITFPKVDYESYTPPDNCECVKYVLPA